MYLRSFRLFMVSFCELEKYQSVFPELERVLMVVYLVRSGSDGR